MIEKSDLDLIDRELVQDFEFYSGKRLFLTGGTGFFGKWLLTAFCFLNEHRNLNVRVTILTRNIDKFAINNTGLYKHNNFEFIQGDIQNIPEYSKKIDYIIHAATDVSKSIPHDEMVRTVLGGVKSITEFSNKLGCKKLLFTSSGAIYNALPEGGNKFVDINNVPLVSKEKDIYAHCKRKSEIYLDEHLKSELVIARCFAFSGPYLPLDGKYAFGNFVGNFINGEAIDISGNKDTVRSYLYAADLVIWLLRILSKGKDREAYNVGSDVSVSIGELAGKISQGKLSLGYSNKKGSFSYYVPDISKSTKELRLDVFTDLEMSIDKTINFYQEKEFNK